jgi:hypothetical protein
MTNMKAQFLLTLYVNKTAGTFNILKVATFFFHLLFMTIVCVEHHLYYLFLLSFLPSFAEFNM